jgi:hypothetical protein
LDGGTTKHGKQKREVRLKLHGLEKPEATVQTVLHEDWRNGCDPLRKSPPVTRRRRNVKQVNLLLKERRLVRI